MRLPGRSIAKAVLLHPCGTVAKRPAQGKGAQPLAAIAIGVCRWRALGKSRRPHRPSLAPRATAPINRMPPKLTIVPALPVAKLKVGSRLRVRQSNSRDCRAIDSDPLHRCFPVDTVLPNHAGG